MILTQIQTILTLWLYKAVIVKLYGYESHNIGIRLTERETGKLKNWRDTFFFLSEQQLHQPLLCQVILMFSIRKNDCIRSLFIDPWYRPLFWNAGVVSCGAYLVELVLNTAGVQAQAWVIVLHHALEDIGDLLVVLGAQAAAEVDVVRDQITTDAVTQETFNLPGVPNKMWKELHGQWYKTGANDFLLFCSWDK